MARPRVRISTLMLLVAVAALAVALVVERRRSSALTAALESERANAALDQDFKVDWNALGEGRYGVPIRIRIPLH